MTAVALSMFGVACGGSKFNVVRESGPPSALTGAEQVMVQFDYSNTLVGGMNEKEWVETKSTEDAEYPTTWADLKGRLESAFTNSFQSATGVGRRGEPGVAPAPNEALLIVKVSEIGIGKYIPVFAPPTKVFAHAVFVVDGKETDEVVVQGASAHSLTRPSVFQHVSPVGQRMGDTAGRFFVHQRSQ